MSHITDNLTLQHKQQPTRMVAGALAYLARHMETGCPRAARLAAMLLEQVSSDPAADAHLREHARELVEILERDPANGRAPVVVSSTRSSAAADRLFAGGAVKVAA
ncbi:MAG: hypothetical protein EPN14_06160 [Gallionella sp.]|nr:MAG: hypothetical protein EPN14_06160 [Gallionella sp.]